MAKPKVFVFAPADPTGNAHKMLEDAGCELILGKANWDTPQGNNEDEMAKMAAGCDALMGTSIRSSPITQKILQASKNLRIVAKFTIGVDDVDVDAATEMGILVTHGPTESNWGGVAEGTITNMLTLWGMKMIGYDPYVPDSKFQQFGVERVKDLSTLLKQSDVVTLHVVLTKETRHMINAETLAMMKKTAILVNTSRGYCVDEKALIDALQNNKIAGATLDVFENEPIAADSPFRKMDDRVLISPHMVSSNYGSGLKTGLLWGTQSVIAALKGEVSPYVYNTEVIDQWKSRFGGKSIL